MCFYSLFKLFRSEMANEEGNETYYVDYIRSIGTNKTTKKKFYLVKWQGF